MDVYLRGHLFFPQHFHTRTKQTLGGGELTKGLKGHVGFLKIIRMMTSDKCHCSKIIVFLLSAGTLHLESTLFLYTCGNDERNGCPLRKLLKIVFFAPNFVINFYKRNLEQKLYSDSNFFPVYNNILLIYILLWQF